MRLLIIAHGFPPLAQGGAEIHAADQAHALAAMGDEVSVLTREAVPERPEYAVRDEHRDGLRIRWVNRTFRDVSAFADSYRSDRIAALAAAFIDEARPDLAHVHHLTGLSTTIVTELARRNIPVVLTLHDYWMLCHRGQLLDLDLRRCADPRACLRCLGPAAGAGATVFGGARAVRALQPYLPELAADFIKRTGVAAAGAIGSTQGQGDEARARMAHMQSVLGHVSALIAPSRHMRDRFVAAGVDPSRVIIAEYGTDLTRFTPGPRRTDGPLRLGFLGSLMVSKAPHLLIEAWRHLPPGAASVTLAGTLVPYHGDHSYRATLTPLLQLPGVTVTGPVPHADVPRLLADLDVLVVPSIWEENSPLVIREAFASGVPVVASRIGGIPETVTDDTNGLLFAPGDVDGLARALSRLVTDPTLLDRLRAGIPRLPSIEDATREIHALYQRLVHPSTSSGRREGAGSGRTEGARSDRTVETARVAAVVLNYRTPDETLLAVHALLASRRPFSQVIVVDNAADHDCEDAMAGVSTDIAFIRTGANLGFSGGVNVGIRRALLDGATHVLLVNSDLILPVRALDALLGAMAAGPRRGIVSPVIASRSTPNRVVSRGMRFSDRTGRMRHRGVGEHLSESTMTEWEPVAAVSGCAMLVARDVFESVGLLAEEYFFSFEDVDFCLAARDKGFEVGVAGRTVAYHEGSRSLGATSVRRLYFAARNHLLAASRRPAGGRAARAFRASAVVGLNVAHAALAPGGSLGARLAAVACGVRDHARGRYGADGAD